MGRMTFGELGRFSFSQIGDRMVLRLYCHRPRCRNSLMMENISYPTQNGHSPFWLGKESQVDKAAHEEAQTTPIPHPWVVLDYQDKWGGDSKDIFCSLHCLELFANHLERELKKERVE